MVKRIGQTGPREWPWLTFWEKIPTFKITFVSFFHIWTHRFSTSSFFPSVLPNGVGWHHGARWWGQSCVYVFRAVVLSWPKKLFECSYNMLWENLNELFGNMLGIFQPMLGIFHRSCAFVLGLVVALLDPSGATEPLSQVVQDPWKTYHREDFFEWSHYSPNWSWVAHSPLKLTVEHAILRACVPYQSHLR